jgi:hypothetical protein
MNRRAFFRGLLASTALAAVAASATLTAILSPRELVIDASWFGLHVDADGETNTRALQAAVDFLDRLECGGEVCVAPGQYKVAKFPTWPEGRT